MTGGSDKERLGQGKEVEANARRGGGGERAEVKVEGWVRKEVGWGRRRRLGEGGGIE